MKIIETRIPDVKIIEPKVFEDNPSFFYESFNEQRFDESLGFPDNFLQRNNNRSVKNTFRGLQCQLPSHAQSKLVLVTIGNILDVAIEIRKNSSIFGLRVSGGLSPFDRHKLCNQPGFALGFLDITHVAEFQYKCTDFYVPEFEASIRWGDAELGIEWPNREQPIVSPRDVQAPLFHNVKCID